jgi:hypothetical protein
VTFELIYPKWRSIVGLAEWFKASHNLDLGRSVPAEVDSSSARDCSVAESNLESGWVFLGGPRGFESRSRRSLVSFFNFSLTIFCGLGTHPSGRLMLGAETREDDAVQIGWVQQRSCAKH